MTTRRTKIVVTLGPATDGPGVLDDLVAAGTDVVRLNLSHGGLDEHVARLAHVRAAADRAGRVVAVLADLPGPKVRTGPFPLDGTDLESGATVELVGGEDPCRPGVVTVDDPDAVGALEPGDRVALGDGNVVLEVRAVAGGRATATVTAGGRLRGRPGVHLPSHRFRGAAFTDEDRDLVAAVAADVDIVAVSFVRTAADVAEAKAAVPAGGPMVMAKIETAAAVDDLDAVLDASDAVMVARGDLGIDVPVEDVPHLQHRIVRAAVAAARPVVTATQMLESMVTSPLPTRAEATDVAKAVADGTDAVMLSGETAIGRHPAHVVATMARIVERAERELDLDPGPPRPPVIAGAGVAVEAPVGPVAVTSAVARAAWQAATDLDVAAVLCCTRSGLTARAMARERPAARLVGLSPSPTTVRGLALSWGVDPLPLPESASAGDLVATAVEAAVAAGRVRPGDTVVVLAGSPGAGTPVTDSLRVVRVPG